MRRPAHAARQAEWTELAARLGLEPAPERAGKLRRLLDLAPDVVLEPLYDAKLEVVPAALAAASRVAVLDLFEYALRRSTPMGEVVHLCSTALLEAPHPLAPVALKALPKQHEVVERLTASASGSTIVPLGDPDFDARVTIYARDAHGAREMLTPAARRVVLRVVALEACGAQAVAPALAIGERHLRISATASAEAPTPMAVLEQLVTDLVSLYGVLAVRMATVQMATEGDAHPGSTA